MTEADGNYEPMRFCLAAAYITAVLSIAVDTHVSITATVNGERVCLQAAGSLSEPS